MVRDDIDTLLVCPVCDALYRAQTPEKGEIARCARCHTVLAAPRIKAGLQIVALSVTSLILIVGAAVFPFLRINARGFQNSASILDTARVFADGALAVLVVATVALILAIPAMRAALVIYVLAPIIADRPAWPMAERAFRLAQSLRPWAMAEIFAIGCAVALVKIADLADVDLGPAFWMFAVLTVLVVVQQRLLCTWSVWNALSRTPGS